MKYRMSFSDSLKHEPKNPERTAKRSLDWDVEFKVFKTRDAMIKALYKQNEKPPHKTDWIEFKKRGES